MGGVGERKREPRVQIRVKGTLDGTWSDWFGGLTLVPLETGETLLTGPVADQSALYGILWKLRDLNLTLVSLVLVERNASEQE
jgi:hypothetical protein